MLIRAERVDTANEDVIRTSQPEAAPIAPNTENQRQKRPRTVTRPGPLEGECGRTTFRRQRYTTTSPSLSRSAAPRAQTAYPEGYHDTFHARGPPPCGLHLPRLHAHRTA